MVGDLALLVRMAAMLETNSMSITAATTAALAGGVGYAPSSTGPETDLHKKPRHGQ